MRRASFAMRLSVMWVSVVLAGCGGPVVAPPDAGPDVPDAGARSLAWPCGAGLRAERLTGAAIEGGSVGVSPSVTGLYTEGQWVIEWIADDAMGLREHRIGTLDGLVATRLESPEHAAEFWIEAGEGVPARRVEIDRTLSGGLVFSVRRWQGGRLGAPERTAVIEEPAWREVGNALCEGGRRSAHLISEADTERLGLSIVDWRGDAPVAMGAPYVPAPPAFGALSSPSPSYVSPAVAGCVERADGELWVGVLRGGTSPQPLLVRVSSTGEATHAPVGPGGAVARLFAVGDEGRYVVGDEREIAIYDGVAEAPLATAALDGVRIDEARLLQFGRYSMLPTDNWLLTWDDEARSFAPPIRTNGVCQMDIGVVRRDGEVLELITRCGGTARVGGALHRVRLCGVAP